MYALALVVTSKNCSARWTSSYLQQVRVGGRGRGRGMLRIELQQDLFCTVNMLMLSALVAAMVYPPLVPCKEANGERVACDLFTGPHLSTPASSTAVDDPIRPLTRTDTHIQGYTPVLSNSRISASGDNACYQRYTREHCTRAARSRKACSGSPTTLPPLTRS
jgi:hypothetical protein